MSDTVTAIIVGGLITILGSYVTTRLTTGTTIKNYMAGGSQKDLGEAASKYADATVKTAELNEKLTRQLESAQEKSAKFESALAEANALVATLQKTAEDDKERRKGIDMRVAREIDDLRADLKRAQNHIQQGEQDIEKLLVKQRQLADNYAGVVQENKRLNSEILKIKDENRTFSEWITQARQIFKDECIEPPLLKVGA